MSDYQNLLSRLESLIRVHSELLLEKRKVDFTLKSLQVIESALKIASRLEKFRPVELSDPKTFFDKFADCITGRIKRTELWRAYITLSDRFDVPHYSKMDFFHSLTDRRGFILHKSGVVYVVPPKTDLRRRHCCLSDIEVNMANYIPPEVPKALISKLDRLDSSTHLLEEMPQETHETHFISISEADLIVPTIDN